MSFSFFALIGLESRYTFLTPLSNDPEFDGEPHRSEYRDHPGTASSPEGVKLLAAGTHRFEVEERNERGVWSVASADSFFIAADGLLAHFPFDSDVADARGAWTAAQHSTSGSTGPHVIINPNEPAPQGSGYLHIQGNEYAGEYLELLSATGDYVDLGSAFTVAFWFRAGAPTGPVLWTIMMQPFNDGEISTLRPISGGIAMQYDDMGGEMFTVLIGDPNTEPKILFAGTPAADPQWRHAALTVDKYAQSVAVYINGRLENSQPLAFDLPTAGLPMRLGAVVADGADLPFAFGTMDIDDFRVYNIALDAASIAALVGGEIVVGPTDQYSYSGFLDGSGGQSVYRPGSYADVRTFTLTTPVVIDIRMSAGFDAYLHLFSGSAPAAANLIAQDDDGWNGTDSRLYISLGAGQYCIEATTFSAYATGNSALFANVALTKTTVLGGFTVGGIGPSGGRIVYDLGYVHPNGWRYLEMAATDLGEPILWGNWPQLVPGTGAGVGDGRANTFRIAAAFEYNENYGAATAALNYAQDGFADWFLPSTSELQLMFNQHRPEDGLSYSNYYWSSVESWGAPEFAWVMDFSTNSTLETGKSSGAGALVRPLRAFRSANQTYAVRYSENGGPQGVPVDPRVYEAGEWAVVLPPVNTQGWEGMQFAGWNADPYGGGQMFSAYDPISIQTFDRVLYAQWTYPPPPPEPLLRWRLDDVLWDDMHGLILEDIGGGYTSLSSADPPPYQWSSAYFDGTNSLRSQVPWTLTTQFTVTAWVRANLTSADNTLFGNAAAGADAAGFKIYLDANNALVLQTGNSTVGSGQLLRTQNYFCPAAAEWVHIAVAVNRDMQQAFIYKNGAGPDANIFGGVRWDFSLTEQLAIGGSTDGAGQYRFSGNIADVRVYPGILSGWDIQQIAYGAW